MATTEGQEKIVQLHPLKRKAVREPRPIVEEPAPDTEPSPGTQTHPSVASRPLTTQQSAAFAAGAWVRHYWQDIKFTNSGTRQALGKLAADAALLGLVLGAIIYAISYMSGPAPTTPFADVARAYTVRDETVVRSAPTAKGSQIIAKLARAYGLDGAWETEPSGARWFRIAIGPYSGDYIWSGNLSSASRPAITQVLTQPLHVIQTSQIRSDSNSDAPVLETVAPGLEIYPFGIVAGGWIEIPLRHGGVGYLPRSAAD